MKQYMRILAASTCLLLWAVRVSAADDDAKAVIEKAIKAHGGADRLAKFQASRTKSKGNIELAGGITFTSESAVQYPDRFKETVEVEVGGNKATIITVYNGKKGWLSVNGETKEMDDKLLDAMKEVVHGMQIMRMAFTKDKKCEFSPLGEIKVNDQPAVGVKVSAKDHKEVNLYFDKKSGLLVKMEHQTIDAMTGKEVAEERIVTEYQEIDKVQVAKKVVINREGKKYIEVEITEQKSLEKIGDEEFDKP
jgi:hypothetical protein